MIPLFVVFRTLGWVNTFAPLIVPHFFGSAFYIFLLRQFFLTIPQELSDAGRIDGASELGIFWRIILPLTRPALATVALLQFLGSYRDFLGPLIYLTDESRYTLSIGLHDVLLDALDGVESPDGGVGDHDRADHHPVLLHAADVRPGHHADGNQGLAALGLAGDWIPRASESPA